MNYRDDLRNLIDKYGSQGIKYRELETKQEQQTLGFCWANGYLDYNKGEYYLSDKGQQSLITGDLDPTLGLDNIQGR